jgi:uncharacterized protein
MLSSDVAQDDVIAALANPAFHAHHPATVTHVQTHISHVFLAGPYAYKLKKAVRFPFLDFSTVERRRHFCAEEVRLNRRLCPTIYLDVVPITRGPTGGLVLGGDGQAVDHVVWMRRLPGRGMLVDRLEAGTVEGEVIDRLASTMATFHAAAPAGPEVAAHADPDRLRIRWEEEIASLRPFVGRLLSSAEHEVLGDFGPSFIRTHETLLEARRRGGRIREGHGDLHAANVCVLEAPDPISGLAAGIYVFDCIEFSHAFRCNDVASEIAFLAMDLESRDRRALARRLVATYAEAADDRTLAVLVPFYGAYRACVRGKVDGLKAAEPEVDARDRDRANERARAQLALAVRYAWEASGPAVVACCGLSGSGKTTLAEGLAATTGYTLLGTDLIRRAGVETAGAEIASYGGGRYTARAREAVYDALCAAAERALAGGHGIVADATFLRARDRARLSAVARKGRVPAVFVECRAAEEIVHHRLREREQSPSLSDARWDTYVAQRGRWEPFGPATEQMVIDTGGDRSSAQDDALRRLWHWRRGRST